MSLNVRRVRACVRACVRVSEEACERFSKCVGDKVPDCTRDSSLFPRLFPRDSSLFPRLHLDRQAIQNSLSPRCCPRVLPQTLSPASPQPALRLRPALVATLAAGAAGPGARLMRSISHGDELSSLNAAKDERGSKRQPEGGCGPSGPAALLTRTGAAGESELSRRVAQSRRAMMLSSSSPHL